MSGASNGTRTGWVADAYLYCNEVLDPGDRLACSTRPIMDHWSGNTHDRTIGADPRREAIQDRHPSRGIGLRAGASSTRRHFSGRYPLPCRSRGALATTSGERTSQASNRCADRTGYASGRTTMSFLVQAMSSRNGCIASAGSIPPPVTGAYRAPTEDDLNREDRVLSLLRERFAEWQHEGYIPTRRIDPGRKTDRPFRERGWTHWHHLFNPRQLLIGGLWAEIAKRMDVAKIEVVSSILASGRLANWNSRLSRWHSNAANGESREACIYNQALNTLNNYGSRAD